MSHKPNTSKLETTVVGSYPADVSANKILNQFYFSSSDSFHDAIKSAVDDEERAGIDLISDGQVRGDIVSLVASRCQYSLSCCVALSWDHNEWSKAADCQ